MATGIKDKVAIIGMGCTRFGERWDMGAEELMVEAFKECLEDAGIEKNEIGLGSCAARVGSCAPLLAVTSSGRPSPFKSARKTRMNDPRSSVADGISRGQSPSRTPSPGFSK